jgi:hypothetical protein
LGLGFRTNLVHRLQKYQEGRETNTGLLAANPPSTMLNCLVWGDEWSGKLNCTAGKYVGAAVEA